MLIDTNYNPDVLSCLANLSSDEVFTPPEVANQVLDLLPDELWSNPDATFLDPCCKSGVFLREIAKRLNTGLKIQIPDQPKRINHIFMKQLYGIGITNITSLLARRSVYCSKYADGKYSVVEGFDSNQGNIILRSMEHTWQRDNCVFCGAAKSEYGPDKRAALESHAYQFIHTANPKDIFGMNFDVIIGNPPYQLSDGGFGTSAVPIYHHFVNQAKKLEPQHLVMIIPARWYSGGRGLGAFRDAILQERKLKQIIDFPDATDVFPGVQIKGGVCIIHWEKSHKGDCLVVNVAGSRSVSITSRPLLENNSDTFIRFNSAIPILRKVQALNEPSVESIMSTSKPFGLRTFFKGAGKPSPGSLKLYQNGGIGYIEKETISKNPDLVDRYKVFVPRAGSGSDSFPHSILGEPIFAEPGTACTETYQVIGPLRSESEAKSLLSYIRTRFFRFLVLMMKNSQDAPPRVYRFVPQQIWDRHWTDEMLYEKYGITDEEVQFIESLVRPME